MAGRSLAAGGTVGGLLLAVLVTVLLRGSPDPADQARPTPGASSPAVSSLPALTALASLAATAPARPPAYDRDAFGPAWTDTDRNGCDTRNDVLRRDLTQLTVKPGTHGCVAASGTLLDPYSGATVSFVRGGPQNIQIDHVVSLADAWRSGAFGWPYAKRLALANDPLELLAVGSAVNQDKSDQTADSWLPATASGRCRLARSQVAVKQKYGLSVTGAERSALTTVLQGCPAEPLPSSADPTLAPNRSPAPS